MNQLMTSSEAEMVQHDLRFIHPLSHVASENYNFQFLYERTEIICV